MRNILIIVAFLELISCPLQASESFHYGLPRPKQTTGRIYATIIAPVSMQSVSDINFGMLVKNKTGQVDMDTLGNLSSTGPGIATSFPSSGQILVKGPKGHFVNVSIPESGIYDNENHSLDFVPKIPRHNRTFALNNISGETTLHIGGTLKFNNTNTPAGTKKGFYVIQTSY